MHQSALDEGVTVKEGDAVEYEVEQGDKGPKAAKVKKA
ncbi:MAG: cold shock domain-containing protein [Nanoarchaeota archaeon]|nr:cold shock domain-containing protein [Nanoarchaeota archaeon]